MAAFSMKVWLAFMMITSWADSGIGSIASSVPSTVYIGKLFVYLLRHFKTFD